MSWKTLDRNKPIVDENSEPILSEAVREKIRSFFPRYETKQAVLLPALHIVQDTLGHIPYQAMKEIADVLEIHPSDVIDTISFYTHFWTHEKGEKVVVACRSISCEAMGGKEVLDTLKQQLQIEEHQTTPDRKYSLVTEECLAACDHAPCLLINEKLHSKVKPGDVAKILADQKNDVIDSKRSLLYDAPEEVASDENANMENLADSESGDDPVVESTSDVQEMKDAD